MLGAVGHHGAEAEEPLGCGNAQPCRGQRPAAPAPGAASCRGAEGWPRGSGASPSCPQCPDQREDSTSRGVEPKLSPPRSWSDRGRGEAELSTNLFFCLLRLRTAQKVFCLWRSLAVVFSRAHTLRTSSPGFTDPSVRFLCLNQEF